MSNKHLFTYIKPGDEDISHTEKSIMKKRDNPTLSESAANEDTAHKTAAKDCAVCPCTENCPIEEAIRMVGGRWKLRILCSLNVDGTLRYNDIKKRMNGITPAVLSSSMKELERDNLVERVQYAEIPPRVEYTITQRGKDLWPILHSLAHWTDK